MSQLLTTRTSMEKLIGIILLNLLDTTITWMDAQLKLNKFILKIEHVFFNPDYEVNLQKRFPGEEISYILWMSFWKAKF